MSLRISGLSLSVACKLADISEAKATAFTRIPLDASDDCWRVDGGTYTVHIGFSSSDIVMTQDVTQTACVSKKIWAIGGDLLMVHYIGNNSTHVKVTA